VLLDETLVCLELLVEERLALSSLITEEAREAVVVLVSDESVSDPVDEVSLPEPPPPLSLATTRDNGETEKKDCRNM